MERKNILEFDYPSESLNVRGESQAYGSDCLHVVVNAHRAQLAQFFHKVRILGIPLDCCPGECIQTQWDGAKAAECYLPSFLFSKANGLSGRGRAGSVAAAGETRELAQDGFSLGSLRAALEGALPMTSNEMMVQVLLQLLWITANCRL